MSLIEDEFYDANDVFEALNNDAVRYATGVESTTKFIKPLNSISNFLGNADSKELKRKVVPNNAHGNKLKTASKYSLNAMHFSFDKRKPFEMDEFFCIKKNLWESAQVPFSNDMNVRKENIEKWRSYSDHFQNVDLMHYEKERNVKEMDDKEDEMEEIFHNSNELPNDELFDSNIMHPFVKNEIENFISSSISTSSHLPIPIPIPDDSSYPHFISNSSSLSVWNLNFNEVALSKNTSFSTWNAASHETGIGYSSGNTGSLTGTDTGTCAEPVTGVENKEDDVCTTMDLETQTLSVPFSLQNNTRFAARYLNGSFTSNDSEHLSDSSLPVSKYHNALSSLSVKSEDCQFPDAALDGFLSFIPPLKKWNVHNRRNASSAKVHACESCNPNHPSPQSFPSHDCLKSGIDINSLESKTKTIHTTHPFSSELNQVSVHKKTESKADEYKFQFSFPSPSHASSPPRPPPRPSSSTTRKDSINQSRGSRSDVCSDDYGYASSDTSQRMFTNEKEIERERGGEREDGVVKTKYIIRNESFKKAKQSQTESSVLPVMHSNAMEVSRTSSQENLLSENDKSDRSEKNKQKKKNDKQRMEKVKESQIEVNEKKKTSWFSRPFQTVKSKEDTADYSSDAKDQVKGEVNDHDKFTVNDSVWKNSFAKMKKEDMDATKNTHYPLIKVVSSRKKKKELSNLRAIQILPAHKGSIWAMKLNSNRKLLATGGKDGLVKVWMVKVKEASSFSSSSTASLFPNSSISDSEKKNSSTMALSKESQPSIFQNESYASKSAVELKSKSKSKSSKSGDLSWMTAKLQSKLSIDRLNKKSKEDMADLFTLKSNQNQSQSQGQTRTESSQRNIKGRHVSGELFYSRDELLIASETQKNTKNKIANSCVKIKKKPVFVLRGHDSDVLDLCWGNTKNILLSSSHDKSVRLWNAEKGECVQIFWHFGPVSCIDVHPLNDSYFVSGCLDKKLRVWNMWTNQVVAWDDVASKITAVSYSADGKKINVGTFKGTCRLFSVKNNKLVSDTCFKVRSTRGRNSGGKKITSIRSMPGDEKKTMVVSNDSRIRIYDGKKLLYKFQGHTNKSYQHIASFNHAGSHIITASENSKVYIWNAEKLLDDDVASKAYRHRIRIKSYEYFDCLHSTIAVLFLPSTPTSASSSLSTLLPPPSPSSSAFSSLREEVGVKGEGVEEYIVDDFFEVKGCGDVKGEEWNGEGKEKEKEKGGEGEEGRGKSRSEAKGGIEGHGSKVDSKNSVLINEGEGQADMNTFGNELEEKKGKEKEGIEEKKTKESMVKKKIWMMNNVHDFIDYDDGYDGYEYENDGNENIKRNHSSVMDQQEDDDGDDNSKTNSLSDSDIFVKSFKRDRGRGGGEGGGEEEKGLGRDGVIERNSFRFDLPSITLSLPSSPSKRGKKKGNGFSDKLSTRHLSQNLSQHAMSQQVTSQQEIESANERSKKSGWKSGFRFWKKKKDKEDKVTSPSQSHFLPVNDKEEGDKEKGKEKKKEKGEKMGSLGKGEERLIGVKEEKSSFSMFLSPSSPPPPPPSSSSHNSPSRMAASKMEKEVSNESVSIHSLQNQSHTNHFYDKNNSNHHHTLTFNKNNSNNNNNNNSTKDNNTSDANDRYHHHRNSSDVQENNGDGVVDEMDDRDSLSLNGYAILTANHKGEICVFQNFHSS